MGVAIVMASRCYFPRPIHRPPIVRWFGWLGPIRRWWRRELRFMAGKERTRRWREASYDAEVWAEHARQMNDEMSLPGDPPYWDEEHCPV